VRYETAEALWADIASYFEFVDQNPIWISELTRSKEGAELVSVPKTRPYTLIGLCSFLGITDQTWYNWLEERPDLLECLTRADRIIRDQKFQGASVEVFNPGFIARDLGMVDRRDVTSKDKSIKDETDFSQLTDDELDQIASLSRKMKKGS
jgi:hypothetical protein